VTPVLTLTYFNAFFVYTVDTRYLDTPYMSTYLSSPEFCPYTFYTHLFCISRDFAYLNMFIGHKQCFQALI